MIYRSICVELMKMFMDVSEIDNIRKLFVDLPDSICCDPLSALFVDYKILLIVMMLAGR